MNTEREGVTRRRFLAGAIGTLAGLLIGDRLTSKQEQQAQARPSPTPTSQPTETARSTQTAQPTPTESPTPAPTPEVKVGELPDVLSSTDKEWEKYFAKETDLVKINAMIKQQQAEENAKAQAENRQPKIIALFLFDPVETAKKGNWIVRKLVGSGGISYSFLLPTGTQLYTPLEGFFAQRGFSSGRKSLDLKGVNGFEFWAQYFGNVEFNLDRVIAGQPYLRTTTETQTFTNAGAVDMKGETTIFGSVRKDATSLLSSIKWLTNEKGQIIHA